MKERLRYYLGISIIISICYSPVWLLLTCNTFKPMETKTTDVNIIEQTNVEAKNFLIDKISKYIETYSENKTQMSAEEESDSEKRSVLRYNVEDSRIVDNTHKKVKISLSIIALSKFTSYEITISIISEIKGKSYTKETFETKTRKDKDLIDYVKATLENFY